MAKFSLTEMEDAPQQVADVYMAFQEGMGFPMVPNFMKVQGRSAAAVSGTWALLQHVLLGGNLPRPLKEMLIAAISHDRDCVYCEAAHLACCRMLGIDSDTLASLVENVQGLTPERLRDIVVFAVKCARDPRSIAAGDFDSLRRHGLNEGDVVELISMAGLALYLNVLADATGVEPDALFYQV